MIVVASTNLVKSLVVVMLFFLLPFSLMLTHEYSIPAWLCLFLVTYLISKLVLSRSADFLYASFLVFFYVFLLLAPIIQVANGEFPWFDFYQQEDIELSWWVTFFALLGFEIGYLLRSKSYSSSAGVGSVLSRQGLICLFAVALLTMLFGIFSIGVSSLFLPRNELSSVLSGAADGNTSTIMIISAIMRVPAVIILIIFVRDLILKMRSGAYSDILVFQKFLVFSLLVFVIIVNNPISTARFWVGAIFLSLLLVYLTLKTRKASIYWFSLNVLVLLLAFPVMDIFRKSLDGDVLQAVQDLNPEKELAESPDFDAFQQQMNTIVSVSIGGVSNGRQIISSLLFFVPRSVWSGKSEPTGVLVADSLGYNFLNLSAPIGAELYMDAKLPGVFIGMIIIGLAYRRLYVMSMSGGSISVAFYYFFCAYQVYFLRGSMMAVIGFVAVAILFSATVNLYRSFLFERMKAADGA